MVKHHSHKKVLEKILVSKDFASLSTYSDAREWAGMTRDERELLALLFVMEGEKHLEAGNAQVLKSFQLAEEIATDSLQVMYRKAVAFSTQTENPFCLTAASALFGKIAAAQPDSFGAWHDWARALVSFGLCTQEMLPLQEALEKFSAAEHQATSEVSLAVFYRDWGLCWQGLGSLSGEACDYRNAIDKFRRAAELGEDAPQFWNEYGRALTQLSMLINDTAMLTKSVELFWMAVRAEPVFYEGWLNIGIFLGILYKMHPQDAYFALSHEGFSRASQLDPQHASLWLQWGDLFALRGKATKDLDCLRESCKKFEVADVCEPNHHGVFAAWSEALLAIGSWTEDLASIHKAHDHILRSLEIQPDNLAAWAIYGRCLTELGRYFNDEQYILQAVDKFRSGLKIDSQDDRLWYGLASAVSVIAQHRNDVELMDESARCFIQAVENGGHASPEVWHDWGQVLIKLSHMTQDKAYVEQALKKFEQAIRLRRETHPRDLLDPEWVYNYGAALELLGDYTDEVERYEQAAQLMKEVLEIDPSFHLVYFNLATIYSCLGELTTDTDYFEEAFECFEKYLSIDGEDDLVWTEWGLTLISFALLVRDPSSPDKAYQLLNAAENKLMQAVALGNVFAHYHLACLYALVGNVAASIHHLERAEVSHVLPSLEDLVDDDWLDGVRETAEFRQFFEDIRRKKTL